MKRLRTKIKKYKKPLIDVDVLSNVTTLMKI